MPRSALRMEPVLAFHGRPSACTRIYGVAVRLFKGRQSRPGNSGQSWRYPVSGGKGAGSREAPGKYGQSGIIGPYHAPTKSKTQGEFASFRPASGKQRTRNIEIFLALKILENSHSCKSFLIWGQGHSMIKRGAMTKRLDENDCQQTLMSFMQTELMKSAGFN